MKEKQGDSSLINHTVDKKLFPKVGKGTKIYQEVKISPMAIIGKNCKISSGVRIGKAQICDNTYIGFKANIYNSVFIGNNVKIEKYVTILPGSVIRCGAIIENGSTVQGYVAPNDKIGANSRYIKNVKHILR